MFRQSPRRNNQMPRGIKIKHVVEGILLLGVCTLFLYQVQDSHHHGHSHGKPKVSEKLGRKDLRPTAVPLDQAVKQTEETAIIPEEIEHFVTEERVETEDGENKVKKEVEDDADDARDVVEVEQLLDESFKDDDDDKNKTKEGQERDDAEGNTFEVFVSPAASPTINKKNDEDSSPMLSAVSPGVVVTNIFFEYSDPNPAPSSIYGDIEAAMKSFFGGSSDDSEQPAAAGPALQISEISAPSESYAQYINPFIDSTGENGAPTSVSLDEKGYRSDFSNSAESPTGGKRIHVFMRPGLESD